METALQYSFHCSFYGTSASVLLSLLMKSWLPYRCNVILASSLLWLLLSGHSSNAQWCSIAATAWAAKSLLEEWYILSRFCIAVIALICNFWEVECYFHLSHHLFGNDVRMSILVVSTALNVYWLYHCYIKGVEWPLHSSRWASIQRTCLWLLPFW